MKEQIACCMIVRDDESTLRQCLESVRPFVDELVVVDTGSTDASPTIARELADKFEVFIGCNDAQTGLIEDFALARNKSWSMAESQVALWLDGDDVLLGGEHLRGLVERTPADASYIWMMRYDYATNTEQDRERMVFPRHKFAWQTPVHEVLLAQPPFDSVVKVAHVAELEPRVRVRHRQTESTKVREAGRNLRILKKYLAKVGEGDPRAMYYCGQEYACQGDMGNALRLLRRFIEIGGWDEERCLALLTIAQLYQTIGDHQSAIEWATRAMHEKSWPEPYFVIARSYYALAVAGEHEEKNFRRCVHFALNGLAGHGVTDGAILLSRNPQSRKDIYEFLNVSLGRLGDLDGAIKACEDGLALNPDNADLLTNLELYQGHRGKRRILSEAESLRDRGTISKDQYAVIELALESKVTVGLLQEDGSTLTGSAPAPAAPAEPLPPPAEGKLRIVFYVGHGLEPWSPKTIEEQGQGGSEIMAWEMAKRLAARGHSVRLYGHLSPAMEGVYDGVQYLDASRFHGVACDVLVASRNPAAVDDVHGCQARARVLWVHDIHCGEALNMPRFLRFDRVLVLSEWHKEFFCGCYGGIDRSKVVVTRNGIDPTWFDHRREAGDWLLHPQFAEQLGVEDPRNPHRAIYSSSPDRGLLTAVECWPEVRKAVPDAELHVFYGFFNWERVANLTGDQAQLRDINHLKALIRATPGVVMRDRVPPKQLALEMMQAGVWAYPTWFQETSCITAMQAQAAGLRTVTSPIAALVETCGDNGVVFIKGKGPEGEWWRQQEYKREWTAAVVAELTTADQRVAAKHGAYLRADIAAAAKERFSLETLADDWDRDLRALVKQVESDVVPRFEAAE